MNALTPAERQRLIDLGLVSFPKQLKPTKQPRNVPVKTGRKNKKKPQPPKFQGTPKQRAEKAVEYARTGLYGLGQCAVACGYRLSASGSIKELLAGHGPATEAAKNAVSLGRVDWFGNRGNLLIIRHFYGISKVNDSDTPEHERLRAELRKHKDKFEQIAELSSLAKYTIYDFSRGRQNGMREFTRNRVWAALRQLGLI